MKKIYFTLLLFLLFFGIFKNFSYSIENNELERVEEEVKFQNAMQFLSLKRYKIALSLLGEYVEIYENGIFRQEALKHIGDIYFKEFDYDRSLRFYEKLYEEYSDTDEGVLGYYKMGLCYIQMGKEKEAKKIFIHIVKEYPTSTVVLNAKQQLDIEKILAY